MAGSDRGLNKKLKKASMKDSDSYDLEFMTRIFMTTYYQCSRIEEVSLVSIVVSLG
jgi:hypothetical protein